MLFLELQTMGVYKDQRKVGGHLTPIYTCMYIYLPETRLHPIFNRMNIFQRCVCLAGGYHVWE